MISLVTGCAGFVGSHLVEYLLAQGDTVFGLDRTNVRKNNIAHLMGKFSYLEADLTDMTSITNVLKEVLPDRIFHLAAQSFVPESWRAPAETFCSNAIGELNLFEAVRHLNINPVIQIACSSEEYGLVLPEEIPIKETNPLRPQSPYAVSKITQDYLAYQYNQSYGLKTIRTRAFNHTGPRRGEQFVTSNFAKQVVEIEKGMRNSYISVGNIDAARDFTDVRDMVRAYVLATEKCDYGEVYNICSDQTTTIREVLNTLLSLSTKKGVIEIVPDPARMRPSDVPVLYGDSSKFRAKTGWKPEVQFIDTMSDLLDYWRETI